MKLDTFKPGTVPTDALLTKMVHTLTIPGAVILIPTETVYGLVCRWDDEAAREKIYALKDRDHSKPLAMFAPSPEIAARNGAILSDTARKLCSSFMPGAITLVMPTQAGSTLGLRIPDHELVLALLKRLTFPLASTSANASGFPNALSCGEALDMLNGEVDLAVDAGTIPESAMASTVVDVTGEIPLIMRRGPVSEEAIAEALRHE